MLMHFKTTDPLWGWGGGGYWNEALRPRRAVSPESPTLSINWREHMSQIKSLSPGAKFTCRGPPMRGQEAVQTIMVPKDHSALKAPT